MAIAVRETLKVLRDKSYLIEDTDVLKEVHSKLDEIVSSLPSAFHQPQKPKQVQTPAKRKNISLKLRRKHKRPKLSKYLQTCLKLYSKITFNKI